MVGSTVAGRIDLQHAPASLAVWFLRSCGVVPSALAEPRPCANLPTL